MGTTSLAKKAFHTIREDGIGGCVKKTNGYIKKQIKKRRRVEKVYKDVLFISGCNEKSSASVAIPGKTSERTAGSYELHDR